MKGKLFAKKIFLEIFQRQHWACETCSRRRNNQSLSRCRRVKKSSGARGMNSGDDKYYEF